MPNKYNPFKPNHPIFDGLFTGRFDELKRIDNALCQTAFENPTNLLFLGERGIGKTSLLLVAKYFANGDITLFDKKHNFISIQININQNTNIEDFVIKFKKQLVREIHKIDKNSKIMDGLWGFLQRLEISGSKINRKDLSVEQLIDNFVYSLSDTVKKIQSERICKDGIVVVIDEVDTATENLKLGSFLKNLSETLVSENTNKVLFILAGLPVTVDILRKSHESSLRLFEELLLKPLSQNNVKEIVLNAIQDINNRKKGTEIVIDKDALESFFGVSEGYPHFLQQIGYSVIDNLASENITKELVEETMFKEGGALDLIGNRYYVDLYYNRINVDSYRQILSIMAERWNDWITKADIRKTFTGSGSELNNGIKALRDRNIILTKRGVKGVYRLQWLSFAFWIRIHKHKKE